MDLQTKTLWGQINKVDQAQHIVGGYFTNDTVDMVGDRIPKETTLAAIPEWAEWSNIREQHGMPCGHATKIGAPDWNYLEARIVSDEAWKLVAGKVYQGFSVGLIVNQMKSVPSRDVPDNFWIGDPEVERKKFPVVNEILDMQIIEISITDRPAHPQAKFTIAKKLDPGIPAGMPEDAAIQSLVFDKNKFSDTQAAQWAQNHGYASGNADLHMGGNIHLDQFSVDECQSDTIATKPVTDGIQAVVCVRKTHKALDSGITVEKADGSSEIQTLLFDKDKFTEEEAKSWAKSHGFHAGKVDITENKIRLRQFDPSECDPNTYGTKPITDGVQAVFCVKKPGKSLVLNSESTTTASTANITTTTIYDASVAISDTPTVEKEVTDEEKSHNELPDEAFAYVEATGHKDPNGRTQPMTARHLPHHTAEVKDGTKNDHIDLPLLRNAYARVGQIKPVTEMVQEELVKKAAAHLENHRSALDAKEKGLMDETTWVRFLAAYGEPTTENWSKFMDTSKTNVATSAKTEFATTKKGMGAEDALNLIRELLSKKGMGAEDVLGKIEEISAQKGMGVEDVLRQIADAIAQKGMGAEDLLKRIGDVLKGMGVEDVIPPDNTPKELDAKETLAKMYEILAKMESLSKAISEPKVETAKEEAVEKTPVTGVVKAEPAQDNTLKAVLEVAESIKGFDEKFGKRDTALWEKMKSYIDELRTSAEPGKAALQAPEESKPEQPVDEKTVRAQRRNLIENAFKSN